MRYVRSAVLDVIRLDYVTTARSKGLTERVVIIKHVVRNALIPVVTLVALQMPAVFGGAIVTEQIFRIPGIGSLLIDAILRNDTPVIMAVTFVFSCLVILFNLHRRPAVWLARPPHHLPLSRGRGCRARRAPASRPGPRPGGASSATGWPTAACGCWALLVLAVLLGPLFYKVGINDIDFTGPPGQARAGAPAGHRRPGPRPAGAHALRRAHLAGGGPGGDADGHHRRRDHRRHRRHLARLGRHRADVGHRPVPQPAAAAAAAAADLPVPRHAEGGVRAWRSASSC